jgi:hypothetical protein
MRRLSPAFALLVGLVLAIAFAGVSTAAPSKFKTFGDGTVSISGGTATLVNDPGEFSGIYLRSRGSAKWVKSVHMSFRYTGSVAGGAPRFSIPLDTDRDNAVDGYAFLDALNCGDSGLVSTDDSDCKVFLNFSSESFANWDDLVAEHPRWRIPPRSIPFVIADQPGTYIVSRVDLR